MKLIVKISKKLSFFALLSAFVFAGCENDSDMDYGFPLRYMPQATITGLDNTYPIPSGPIEEYSTYSCYYENGHLNIALGALRAGKIADAKGFSVAIRVSPSETAEAVAKLQGEGVDAMALPNVYTLPGSITVEAGKNSGSTYLSINMNQLAQVSEIVGEDNKWKILVLAVEIADPSEYELADTNTSVVINIDLNSSYWDWGTPPNLVYTK